MTNEDKSLVNSRSPTPPSRPLPAPKSKKMNVFGQKIDANKSHEFYLRITYSSG